MVQIQPLKQAARLAITCRFLSCANESVDTTPGCFVNHLSYQSIQIKKIAAIKITAIILSKARMRRYWFRFITVLLMINPSECTRKM